MLGHVFAHLAESRARERSMVLARERARQIYCAALLEAMNAELVEWDGERYVAHVKTSVPKAGKRGAT